MLKKIIMFTCLLTLAFVTQGCVMKSTPFKAVETQEDKALLYIYRPESIISRGIQFSIIVNDKETISPLINNAYVPFFVKPGNVRLVLQVNSFPKGTLHDVTFEDLKSGGVYYIKANPALFGAYKLIMMDEAVGKSELKNTLFFQAN